MAKIKIVFEDDETKGTVLVYAEGLDKNISLADIKQGKNDGKTQAATLAIGILQGVLFYNDTLGKLDEAINSVEESEEELNKKKYFN